MYIYNIVEKTVMKTQVEKVKYIYILYIEVHILKQTISTLYYNGIA